MCDKIKKNILRYIVVFAWKYLLCFSYGYYVWKGRNMAKLQENCEKGILDKYTKCMIIDMSKKVVRNLLGNKFPEIRKEVEIMMGGKVLDFEAKRIKDEGRKEGIEKGREEALSSLVNSLRKFVKDLEEIYNIVVENELYKNVTKEQVEKYYYSK